MISNGIITMSKCTFRSRIMRSAILTVWNFVFDHEKSPLRHIPDFNVRHMVFQLLGWMWAVCFSLAIGSYTFLAYSLIGHAFLIGAAAITVTTYTAATLRPRLFARTRSREPMNYVDPAPIGHA